MRLNPQMVRAVVLALPLAVLASAQSSAQGVALQDIINDIAPLRTATIYTAREIITMDPDLARAEAVAVVGDRIAAVGSRAQLEALAGDQPSGSTRASPRRC